MSSCREVAEAGSDYLERALPWPRRLAITLHLCRCLGCRNYFAQLRGTVDILRRLPAEGEPSDLWALLAAFRARVGGQHRAVTLSPWVAAAAVLAPSSLTALASKAPVVQPGLAPAVLLTLLAAAVAGASRSFGWWGLPGTIALSLGVSLASAGPGPAYVPVGLECLGLEAASMVAALAVVGLAYRRRVWLLDGATAATTLLSAVLGGQAALSLACPVTSSLLHALLFHTGGVVLAAGFALVLGRWLNLHTSAAA